MFYMHTTCSQSQKSMHISGLQKECSVGEKVLQGFFVCLFFFILVGRRTLKDLEESWVEGMSKDLLKVLITCCLKVIVKNMVARTLSFSPS